MAHNGEHDPSAEALFRFGVVSQVLTRTRSGHSRSALVREVASWPHLKFSGEPRRVSPRTLHRWVRAYQERGLLGLEPTSRLKEAASVALSPELVRFAASEKERDPAASIPELIRRAREYGILQEAERVDRTTVFRELRRQGSPTRLRRGAKDRDSLRFAYPHRMLMVLVDGKHFRAGGGSLKRVALFFLDDCSRLGLHVVVGTSESAALFLLGFYEMVGFHGLPAALYIDRGPGFRAEDTYRVMAKLDPPVPIIHGEAAYKEGHGKVERFNRTAKADVLRSLERNPAVDADLPALELRLGHYLREVYNHRGHESLGGETPASRFARDERALCFPEDRARFRERFLLRDSRLVTNDHTVPVGRVAYGMPRGTAGMRVQIQRHLLDGKVFYVHQGRRIELHPVDLAENARTKRSRRRAEAEPAYPLPSTAADLAFTRALRPVVGPDGGYLDPDEGEGDD